MNTASRITFILLAALSGFAADGIGDPLPHEAAESIWMEVKHSYHDPFVKMNAFIIPETYMIFTDKSGTCALAYANLIYNCDKNGYVSGRDPRVKFPIGERLNVKSETILLRKVAIQLILQYQSDMREKNEATKKTHPLEFAPPTEAYTSLFADNATEKEAQESVIQFFSNRDIDLVYKKAAINWDGMVTLMDERSLVVVRDQTAHYYCFGYIETAGQKYLVTAGASSAEKEGKKEEWGYRVANVKESAKLQDLVEIRPWTGVALDGFIVEKWTRDEARLKQRIDDIVKKIEER